MVVLHKLYFVPYELFEFAMVEAFKEEASFITKDSGFE